MHACKKICPNTEMCYRKVTFPWNDGKRTKTLSQGPLPSRKQKNDNLSFDIISDPRLWSRDEVRQWLLWMSVRHSLPSIDPGRFQMNGKALCLMSLAMFSYRVPLGGKLLYKDFQLRLTSAFHLEKHSGQNFKFSWHWLFKEPNNFFYKFTTLLNKKSQMHFYHQSFCFSLKSYLLSIGFFYQL